MKQRIVFVGAGRLATNLAIALCEKGHIIEAVYSRTRESAEALAQAVGSVAVTDVRRLPQEADAFILAVKDSVLADLIAQLAEGREDQTFFHTAGSVSTSVFGSHRHHGVIYPMQTFSKERRVDFSRIPVFIEGSDADTLRLAHQLASSVSNHVSELTIHSRRYAHLAAVFACNFANHCYALSAEILEKHGLSFDIMLPLIEETARKVATMHPRQAQTGPAIRYDENVMEAQRQLLEDDSAMRDIYDLMSKSIHQLNQ